MKCEDLSREEEGTAQQDFFSRCLLDFIITNEALTVMNIPLYG